jgi:BASS family bile acid:Na+ symporter
VLIPLGVAIVMLSLGLSLTLADFRRIFVFPRGVMIGLANLLVLSPMLAFGVAEAWGLSAVLAVGLVLLGSTPGGAMANMFTHLARGDTALSVTMTALSSLAAIVTVPLFLGLAIEFFDAAGLSSEVDMPSVIARIFFITLVPLSIGMAIRARRTEWVTSNEGRARMAAIGALAMVIVGAVISEFDTLRDNFLSIAGAALTLNVLAMAASYTIARISRLDPRQATAIAMELGVHNGSVAIAVGTTISEALIIPAAVYSGFMFLTAGLFAHLMYRRNAVGERNAGGAAVATVPTGDGPAEEDDPVPRPEPAAEVV